MIAVLVTMLLSVPVPPPALSVEDREKLNERGLHYVSSVADHFTGIALEPGWYLTNDLFIKTADRLNTLDEQVTELRLRCDPVVQPVASLAVRPWYREPAIFGVGVVFGVVLLGGIMMSVSR